MEPVLKQMAVIFAMMVLGYCAWRRRWITATGSGELSTIVVNILNPVLILQGALAQKSRPSAGLLVQNLWMSLLCYFILLTSGPLLVRLVRPRPGNERLYLLMTATTNVGFMGIPVLVGLYGPGVMIHIVFYIIWCNVVLYTYGLYLASKASGEPHPFGWKQLMNPGLLASLAALALFLLDIRATGPVLEFFTYVGKSCIPLSMLLIGAFVAQADLRHTFENRKVYSYTLLKMVLIPVAVALLARYIPVDRTVRGVFVVETAMPVGTLTALIARQYGMDTVTCTESIVVTTLVSMVSVPLVFACMG
ncbi:MAG: AEC family transporter [Kiritimatiellia bacterium]